MDDHEDDAVSLRDELLKLDARGISRRGTGLLLLALTGGSSLGLVGCDRGAPRRPPKLTGEALAAEIARLEAALAEVPHVTAVRLEYTDNITNGQGFMGWVDTDTNDQDVLDGVLDQVVRILWGTRAFYPQGISTSAISKDQTKRGDFRALGAMTDGNIYPDQLEKRYGPPGFLLRTATTAALPLAGARSVV